MIEAAFMCSIQSVNELFKEILNKIISKLDNPLYETEHNILTSLIKSGKYTKFEIESYVKLGKWHHNPVLKQ